MHWVEKWKVHLNLLSPFIEAFGKTFISNHIKVAKASTHVSSRSESSLMCLIVLTQSYIQVSGRLFRFLGNATLRNHFRNNTAINWFIYRSEIQVLRLSDCLRCACFSDFYSLISFKNILSVKVSVHVQYTCALNLIFLIWK